MYETDVQVRGHRDVDNLIRDRHPQGHWWACLLCAVGEKNTSEPWDVRLHRHYDSELHKNTLIDRSLAGGGEK